MMEHHADGEDMDGVTELELLRVLLPRNCEHCKDGLLVLDNFDPDAMTCLNCGRGTFCPPPGLAEEPDREVEVHAHRGLSARMARRTEGCAKPASTSSPNDSHRGGYCHVQTATITGPGRRRKAYAQRQRTAWKALGRSTSAGLPSPADFVVANIKRWADD